MNWEAIGSIGEIIGALAVVVTLIVLIKQIRENTRSTNASTASAYMQAYSQANGNLGDPIRASIARRGTINPTELSEDEQQAFFHILCSFLPLWESLFHMHLHGTIPTPHWMVARHDIVSLSSTKGGRDFFDGFLDFYDKSFPEFADEIRTCIVEDSISQPSPAHRS